MKIITGVRGSGKTTRLIQESAMTGKYILVATQEQVVSVAKTAQELDIKIPYPITIEDLKNPSRYIKTEGVLVDESMSLLQYLVPVKIHIAVVDTTQENRLSN